MPNKPSARLSRLTLIGKENLPADGGYMVLPNVLDFQDLLRLEHSLRGRKLAFLIEDPAHLPAEITAHIDQEHITVLVVSPETTDLAAYRQALKEAVADGAVIIHIPAPAVSINAPLTTIPGEKLEFLMKAAIPIVPLHVQRAIDVCLPIYAKPSADSVTMAFGPALVDDQASIAHYHQSLLALSEQCFSRLPVLDVHLGYAMIKGIKTFGSQKIIDGKEGGSPEPLTFDKIFAAACALSGHIRSLTTKSRVGIVLPPSPIGLIANLAVILAGKIPVNLNFTAGRGAIESAIKQGDLDRFLTADTFVRKVQTFPWPPTKNLVLLERLMPTLKTKLTLWFILGKILPAAILALLLGVPRKGGNKEAALLFTSGSSGDPKGVVLTHRNLIANVLQFGSRLAMGGKTADSVLGCLPLFHSFGCTVTLWYPVLFGLDVVYYPSPMEIKRLAELIQTHKVTLMIATPTFLRGYLRGVNREQLNSVKFCVTGAEKLPRAVAEAFENKFGKVVLEGYGLTETSPVSNLNLSEPEPSDKTAHTVPRQRSGTVGQVLPGMAVKITHPETNDEQPLNHSGIIWFKGANVFTGYLNDPKRSAEVLSPDGWFRTGDVGRVDLDGFLSIEGRISRFSKIAGEMVPHETVEEAIVRALGFESESTRKVAIVGIPDIDRGEALVMLTSEPGGSENQEIVQIRHRLLDRGVPPLWIPKRMIRVHDIPVLASGKLDVKACEKIARAGSPP
jgi:acyl-[acyl-carrier-protein]-phospholipid O-acyltransferase / long-chain-fatty-acid--[acyl-carrier-protein] ligase